MIAEEQSCTYDFERLMVCLAMVKLAWWWFVVGHRDPSVYFLFDATDRLRGRMRQSCVSFVARNVMPLHDIARFSLSLSQVRRRRSCTTTPT